LARVVRESEGREKRKGSSQPAGEEVEVGYIRWWLLVVAVCWWFAVRWWSLYIR